jgi:hypothetical protein
MRKGRLLLLALATWFATVGLYAMAQTAADTQSPAKARTRAVGTVKSISGDTVTLTTDTGSEINVVIAASTRLVRTVPGQTDLKNASPAQLSDVQVGDRLLAGGTASDDGKSVAANTAIIMKKSDIAEKQAHDREDWQKHGVGGMVKTVDPATGTITIPASALDPKGILTIQTSKSTVLLRYAPDSVNFDDAKPAPLSEIKPGDQLRARGTKSDDGKQLTADEIVSGTFRNVAGTVVSKNEGQDTVTVQDLATKKPVVLKINSQSQLRKLPPMVAQRIAARLKGGAGAAGGAGSTGGAPAAGGVAGSSGAANATRPSESASSGAPGGSRGGGAPDFQQILNRMPTTTLADLQKGDALMIVATEGSSNADSTAIVLLSGVEPILTASPKEGQTVLSPWNLSLGGNAGTGDTQ